MTKKFTLSSGLKVKYTPWGIASRQKDLILLNNRLTEYPLLHDKILQHEMDHSSGFTWHDLMIDIKNSHLKGVKCQYYKFLAKNPKSWTEFLPFWFRDGTLVVNPTILLLCGITMAIIGGLGWFIGLIS